jgi:hypothetical protein
MLINAALLYYTFNQLSGGYYLTGYFIGLKLFMRFYTGGVRRAKSLADEKNEEGIRIFNIKNGSLMNRIQYARSSGYPYGVSVRSQ